MCLLKMCDKIYFSSKQLETIQEAFDHFDINGDGLISIDELRNVLDSLGLLQFPKDSLKNLTKEGFNDSDGRSKGINYNDCCCWADTTTSNQKKHPKRKVSDESIIAEMYLSEWDGDGDGCVDFKEFLFVVSRMLTEDVTENSERMKEAFRMFDKDDNGYITSKELSEMMQQLGQNLDASDIECMIKEADLDLDGRISFQEFKTILKSPD